MSFDFVKENIPSFLRRIGDRVVAGSNNSTMIFGTDRVSESNSGYGHINSEDGGKNAGSWHVVTGLKGENPSFSDDDSFIYMSMKTDVDNNIGSKHEFVTNKLPALLMKSNAIRMIARKDFKIIVGKSYITIEDGKMVIDGEVKLGSGAVQHILKGEEFIKYIEGHSHPSPSGPTGKPLQKVPDSVLSKDKFVK